MRVEIESNGTPNNSFNRSGISLDFIVNLSHDAVVSRPVNSGVRPLRLCGEINVMSKSTLITLALTLFLVGQCFGVSGGVKAQQTRSVERDLSHYDRIGHF